MLIRRHRKSSLTLIELMIVISLAAIALGTLAFQGNKALKDEKFNQSVELVLAKINLAQQIMLDFQTDVKLEFKFDPNQGMFACTLIPDRALPQNLEKGLKLSQHIPLITEISFDHDVRNHIVLQFSCDLGATPAKTLELWRGEKEETIALRGFPKCLKRGTLYEENTGRTPSYPEEILSTL